MPILMSIAKVEYTRRSNFPRSLTMWERLRNLTDARVISRMMVRVAKRNAPVRTGALKKSIRGGTRGRKRSAILHLSAKTPYAVYVESGYPNPRTQHFLRRPFRRFQPRWSATIRKGSP